MPHFQHFGTPHFKFEFYARLAASSDQKLFNNFFLMLKAIDLSENAQNGQVSIHVDTLKSLLVLPPVEELLPTYVDRLRHAEVAGLLLWSMYHFSSAGSDCSLLKAVNMAYDKKCSTDYLPVYLTIEAWNEKRSTPLARSTVIRKLENVFREYRPVAHICASLIDTAAKQTANQEATGPGLGIGHSIFDIIGSGKHVLVSFEKAKEFLKFGTHHKSSRTGTKGVQPNFLKPKQAWTLPPHVSRDDADDMMAIEPVRIQAIKEYESFYSHARKWEEGGRQKKY